MWPSSPDMVRWPIVGFVTYQRAGRCLGGFMECYIVFASCIAHYVLSECVVEFLWCTEARFVHSRL